MYIYLFIYKERPCKTLVRLINATPRLSPENGLKTSRTGKDGLFFGAICSGSTLPGTIQRGYSLPTSDCLVP